MTHARTNTGTQEQTQTEHKSQKQREKTRTVRARAHTHTRAGSTMPSPELERTIPGLVKDVEELASAKGGAPISVQHLEFRVKGRTCHR